MRRSRVRKDEVPQDTNGVPADQPAVFNSISCAVPANGHAVTELSSSISSGPSTSMRPKRVRRQVRRRSSPGPFGNHNGASVNEEVTSVDSEEPDTPLALTLSRISAAQKSVNTLKKDPQPRGIPASPSLPNSIASAQAPLSTSKAGEVSATPSLKIRLPGRANLHRAPLSTSSQAPASSGGHEQPSLSVSARNRTTRTPRISATVAPRERRSSRRDRASTSAPVQDAPASNDADH